MVGVPDERETVTINSAKARLVAVTVAVTLATLVGCKNKGEASGEISRNWMPPVAEVVMGVPAAEAKAAIQTRLAAKPPERVGDDEWKHVKKLYTTFNQTLLWLDDKGVHQPRVSALLNVLASADSDAIQLDAYPLTELGRTLAAINDTKPTAQQLAEADVLLSTAFAIFGEQMLTGQFKPSSLGQSWHINPTEERIDSALALTLREDDLGAGLKRMRPQDASYDSLRMEFGRYRELLMKGGWAAVPSGRPLKRGDSDSPARIAALRARLFTEGYLTDTTVAAPPPAPDTTTGKKARAARPEAIGPGAYDRALAGAVAEFQARHGIVVDSMLGEETVNAMNVPIQYRVAQIAANLERYRWMPRSLGERYIFVNVPQFKLTAFDSGKKQLEMKVIVGKDYEDRATPVFSDVMEYVIFRPYWNVTPTIAAKEIFPKGPEYIAANDMEVYTESGRPAIRQRPGPKNSLGLVKFIFPNDFNIYLHDTPNGELFKKDVRAFSHGCIRLEKPAELAQWVLGWPADKVEAAMHGSNDRRINLPRKIPVYIVYFTTMVDGGKVTFGNDLYDRDNKLVDQLQNAAVSTPETVEAQKALRTLGENK
jgi:L,D-transpeptidase YcbB